MAMNSTTNGLGWIGRRRMQKDYELVQTYLVMESPFAVESAFTKNCWIPSVKMDAGKVGSELIVPLVIARSDVLLLAVSTPRAKPRLA